MNKKYIFLLGIIFLLNQSSHAQSQSEEIVYKKNAIKFSTTAFFASSFVLSYERQLKESIGLQITAGLTANEKNSYISGSNASNYANKDKVFGYCVDGALRFYLTNSPVPLKGLYASPYGRYQNFDFTLFMDDPTTPSTSTTDQLDYNLRTYEGGALFGYQAVIADKLIFDMFLGGCLKYSESNKPTWYGYKDYSFVILEGFDYTGVAPRIGVRIGMKF